LSKRLNPEEVEDKGGSSDVEVIRPQVRNIGSSSVKRGEGESPIKTIVEQESS